MQMEDQLSTELMKIKLNILNTNDINGLDLMNRVVNSYNEDGIFDFDDQMVNLEWDEYCSIFNRLFDHSMF